jgi:uncharacterized protein YjbI with pentapeptide repeats
MFGAVSNGADNLTRQPRKQGHLFGATLIGADLNKFGSILFGADLRGQILK